MEGMTKATIRATADDLTQMIRKASLRSRSEGPVHSEIYMSVSNARIEFLAPITEDWIVSYSTFDTGFFDSVDVMQKNLIEKNEGNVEAIINVEDFLTYLSRAEDNSNQMVEMTLIGDENDRLCHTVRFEGVIFSEMILPASESNMEEVPLDSLKLYDDEIYSALRGNDGTMEATIETTVEEIERIVGFVNDHEKPAISPIAKDKQIYPIIIQNDTLLLSVGRGDQQDTVWGELKTEIVAGPDLFNVYSDWFEKVFESMSGEVRIKTGVNMPLCVIQTGDEHVVRHVLRPLDEATSKRLSAEPRK